MSWLSKALKELTPHVNWDSIVQSVAAKLIEKGPVRVTYKKETWWISASKTKP